MSQISLKVTNVPRPQRSCEQYGFNIGCNCDSADR